MSSPSRSPRDWFRSVALVAVVSAGLLSIIGSSGGVDDAPPSTTGPNEGSGALFIQDPASGAYQTDRLTVTLGGSSFVPDGASCPALIGDGVLPHGYQVTWSNNSTGAAGNAGRGLLCAFVVAQVRWSAHDIPLALGANSITVTATDSAGNVGRDTIIVTRLLDTTPPRVVSVLPIDGATGVGINSSVTVYFSEEMDPSTINAETITLNDGADNPVLVTVTHGPWSATLTPTNFLAFNTTYQATVTTGVRDAVGGNALAVPFTFSFTTRLDPETTPPSVQSVSPASGSRCASTSGPVTATFSEDLDPATVNAGTFLVTGAGNQAVTGTASYIGNQTAAFAPDAPLATSGSFTATLTTGIKDLSGNALASPFTWNFTTIAQEVGSWAPTSLMNAPYARGGHVAVWTGSEMIIVGGFAFNSDLSVNEYTDQFGRYNPVTDTWTLGSGAPTGLDLKAVWTGSRMLIWGGLSGTGNAALDPGTNTWTPIATTNQPAARVFHTVVWTGSEMIVWGGSDGTVNLNTGGRYDPITDTWQPVSTTGAPSARYGHTAVWTGSEMIVWGAAGGSSDGGRYNPATDTWLPVSAADAPFTHDGRTAVWTGSEMIVWGGGTNSGGAYNPATDSWRATDTLCAPSGLGRHSAIWTGARMVVWGATGSSPFGDGAAYDPVGNTWAPLAVSGAPTARANHTAVWTGSEMIIWGGDGLLNTGGRFTP